MIVYLQLILALLLFSFFFSLIFNCFQGQSTMCAELSGLGGGKDRQTENRRVKTPSFNILNEMCRPFSPNIILKGNSLSVGKIYWRILKTHLTTWVGATVIPIRQKTPKPNQTKPLKILFSLNFSLEPNKKITDMILLSLDHHKVYISVSHPKPSEIFYSDLRRHFNATWPYPKDTQISYTLSILWLWHIPEHYIPQIKVLWSSFNSPHHTSFSVWDLAGFS